MKSKFNQLFESIINEEDSFLTKMTKAGKKKDAVKQEPAPAAEPEADADAEAPAETPAEEPVQAPEAQENLTVEKTTYASQLARNADKLAVKIKGFKTKAKEIEEIIEQYSAQGSDQIANGNNAEEKKEAFEQYSTLLNTIGRMHVAIETLKAGIWSDFMALIPQTITEDINKQLSQAVETVNAYKENSVSGEESAPAEVPAEEPQQ